MAITRQFFIPWGMDGWDAAPGATTFLWAWVAHQAAGALDRSISLPYDCRLRQVQLFGSFGTPAGDGQLPSATPPVSCSSPGSASGFVTPITNDYQVHKNGVSVVSLPVTKTTEGNIERCHIGEPNEHETERSDDRMYGIVDCDVSYDKGDQVRVVVVSPNSPYWVTEPTYITVNTLWQVFV